MKILEFQQIDELNDFETGWNRLLFKSLDTYPSTIKIISSKRCKAEFVAVGDADYQAFSIDQFLSQLFLEEVIKTNE